MFESLLTSRLEMRKIVENHTWREEKFRMALTIDERCEISKDFGTTFYEKVEDCEDILKTLQEGIQKGRRYEEMLKKMRDMEYVDKWPSSSEKKRWKHTKVR